LMADKVSDNMTKKQRKIT